MNYVLDLYSERSDVRHKLFGKVSDLPIVKVVKEVKEVQVKEVNVCVNLNQKVVDKVVSTILPCVILSAIKSWVGNRFDTRIVIKIYNSIYVVSNLETGVGEDIIIKLRLLDSFGVIDYIFVDKLY